MISTLPPHSHSFTQNHYTPHHPSPLSSSPLRASSSPNTSPLSDRDLNVPPRFCDTIMSSPSKPKPAQFLTSPSIFTTATTTPSNTRTPLPSPPSTSTTSKFSKRPAKSNPLTNGRATGDEGRETRRKLFLKRVRQGSEEKRWKERGGDEEIMRCLWVSEERRRVEGQRREALGIEELEEEDEMGMVEGQGEERMAEEVAREEEAEIEALLGSWSQDEVYGTRVVDLEMGLLFEGQKPGNGGEGETPYGSDDEEYDDIFMDVIEQESRAGSQQQPQYHGGGYEGEVEMMDMS